MSSCNNQHNNLDLGGDHTFVASSTLESMSTNLKSSGLVNSPTLIVLQSRFANLASGAARCGGLSISSCTATEDTEDVLVALGLGGYRMSLKLCLCWAALLGFWRLSEGWLRRGDRDMSVVGLGELICDICELGDDPKESRFEAAISCGCGGVQVVNMRFRSRDNPLSKCRETR